MHKRLHIGPEKKRLDRPTRLIAGELQSPPHLYKHPSVKVFKQEGLSPESLIKEGAEILVFFNPSPTVDLELLEPIVQLAGELGPQRVVKNPSLSIYRVRKKAIILRIRPNILSLSIARF